LGITCLFILHISLNPTVIKAPRPFEMSLLALGVRPKDIINIKS